MFQAFPVKQKQIVLLFPFMEVSSQHTKESVFYRLCKTPWVWKKSYSSIIDISTCPKYEVRSQIEANRTYIFTKSKVHGAIIRPTWVLSAQDGPHVGPIKNSCPKHMLASNGDILFCISLSNIHCGLEIILFISGGIGSTHIRQYHVYTHTQIVLRMKPLTRFKV